MIPPKKGCPPSTQSLRAWTKQPEDKQHPSGYFFYFGLPDNASMDNEDYVPGLTTDFEVACAVILGPVSDKIISQ